MGLTEPRIYIDSCVAIYLVEEHGLFASSIEELLESVPDANVYVSDLGVMECLIKPLRDKNTPLEEKFKQWFDDVIVLPVTRNVFTEAARLRADHPNLKTPDAIHFSNSSLLRLRRILDKR